MSLDPPGPAGSADFYFDRRFVLSRVFGEVAIRSEKERFALQQVNIFFELVMDVSSSDKSSSAYVCICLSVGRSIIT